ncbi:putative glycine-rich RNA binding protein [Paratrimastix pyriformis]|uniref:Glycine-rich RNA binding protein n=1 Tax=Paratrimastix pyriformis TaxID=342808 RepID=A0ABQ8U990_9EUKA|nr:putative glycine-rich RNA binding protein [Paratrimastix pyriformis]
MCPSGSSCPGLALVTPTDPARPKAGTRLICLTCGASASVDVTRAATAALERCTRAADDMCTLLATMNEDPLLLAQQETAALSASSASPPASASSPLPLAVRLAQNAKLAACLAQGDIGAAIGATPGHFPRLHEAHTARGAARIALFGLHLNLGNVRSGVPFLENHLTCYMSNLGQTGLSPYSPEVANALHKLAVAHFEMSQPSNPEREAEPREVLMGKETLSLALTLQPLIDWEDELEQWISPPPWRYSASGCPLCFVSLHCFPSAFIRLGFLGLISVSLLFFIQNKLFVGNLNFKTTPDELGSLFAEVGEVVNVNIISRGNYSLGYGFVEMKNEEDVARAQVAMDKKELDGRTIHVEVARPRVERAPGEPRPAPRGPRRVPFRGPRGAPPQGNMPPQQGAYYGYGYPAYGYPPQGSYYPQAPYGGRRFAGPRRPRAPRPDAANAPLSKTRLFVANLPFSVTSEQLAQSFADYGVKEAHIAQRRFNGASRGYGFIELNDESQQQNAIAAMNEKEISGRKILVKVGREPIPREAPVETAPAAAEQKTA